VHRLGSAVALLLVGELALLAFVLAVGSIHWLRSSRRYGLRGTGRTRRTSRPHRPPD
jgi:hypothetical protein